MFTVSNKIFLSIRESSTLALNVNKVVLVLLEPSHASVFLKKRIEDVMGGGGDFTAEGKKM